MSLAGLFSSRWPGVALFDLDGTLVDSAPDLAAAVDQMLEHLGRSPVGIDRVRDWVGNGASVLVRRALARQTDWEPAQPKDDALFNDALAIFFHAYEQINGQHAVVYDGVEACLAKLKGHGCKLAVVTNKPEQFIAPLLEQMAWTTGSICRSVVTPCRSRNQTPLPCCTPWKPWAAPAAPR